MDERIVKALILNDSISHDAKAQLLAILELYFDCDKLDIGEAHVYFHPEIFFRFVDTYDFPDFNTETEEGVLKSIEQAEGINQEATLKSVDVGFGRVSLTHFKLLGYSSEKEMYDDAFRGASNQIRQFTFFIVRSGLIKFLENCQPITFLTKYFGYKVSWPSSEFSSFMQSYHSWRKRI